jgi:hypothetical protein
MASRPDIKPGDWITIGGTNCVVSIVRGAGDPMGDCEVVFNPQKPTNHDAVWTGENWDFAKQGDFGGYADKYPRLQPYVEQLKGGRWKR